MLRPSSWAYFSRLGRSSAVLVAEQLVVHLPELPLRAGGHRRLGGRLGVVVERERVVLPHHADLARVLLLQLRQRRLDARCRTGTGSRRTRRPARAPFFGPFDGDLPACDLVDLGLVFSGPARLGAARPRRRCRHVRLRVLHERLVDLGLGRPLGDQRLGRLQLLVDLGLERLERLRARQELAVDEERRRATRADLAAAPPRRPRCRPCPCSRPARP